MTVLIFLCALLLAVQIGCMRAVRREQGRLMRPADELDEDDIRRWLDLIEPFPLAERPRLRR